MKILDMENLIMNYYYIKGHLQDAYNSTEVQEVAFQLSTFCQCPGQPIWPISNIQFA